MRQSDLTEAARIFRVAFGTFVGLPDPDTFVADRDYIATRFHANAGAALAAEIDGELAGSNFATLWGSFGFFGPLTVRPEPWGTGVAQALLGPTMDLFDQNGVRDAGLFTFVQSPKHLALYQKFGFWPGFLVGLMGKSVEREKKADTLWSPYSAEAARDCRALTDALYEGLDVSAEIRAVAAQGLGETVLVWGGDALEALAICHCGAGTEAGAGNCYIKFAAARPGPGVSVRFDRLLDACESMASARGLTRIETGVNFERIDAYRQMLDRGYKVERQALAMHRDGRRAYNRRDAFVLDDLR
jgi:GNAT superfamily N-acetyltransferase